MWRKERKEQDTLSEVKEKQKDRTSGKKWIRQNLRRRGGDERRLSPSRRTKDEANNGEAFSEAEVAGRSIFSLISMQPGEGEREREGNRERGVKKEREERRDEC